MKERDSRSDSPFEAGCLDEEILHRYAEGELSDELAREVDQAAKRSPDVAREIARLVRERVELAELLASLGSPTRAPDLPNRFATRVAAQAARERASQRRSIYARRLLHAVPAALVALAFFAPGPDFFTNRSGEPDRSTAVVTHGVAHQEPGKVERAEPSIAPALPFASIERPGPAPRERSDRSSATRGGGSSYSHAGADQAFPRVETGAQLVSYEPSFDVSCSDGDEPKSTDDGIDPVFPPSVLVCKSCVAPVGSERASDPPASTRVARRVEESAAGDPIGYVIRHARREHERTADEPCPPDPNADGVFDASDFVYVLQHGFSVAHAAPVERLPSSQAADQRDGCEEEDAPATSV
ncbi:MAG TPA: hypothetical protein VK116_01725 [Planctomycetota bacterium]|nr:hypothetical protein [Planctomycetota bacterium]